MKYISLFSLIFSKLKSPIKTAQSGTCTDGCSNRENAVNPISEPSASVMVSLHLHYILTKCMNGLKICFINESLAFMMFNDLQACSQSYFYYLSQYY